MATPKLIEDLLGNIGRVIVGKEQVVKKVLAALLCRGHVLIEDVPGVGKTTLASALARSLACSFRRIQFTPDITPSDLLGYSVANVKTGEFEYRQGLLMSQVVLADEINRASPKTQSALLEVMDERQMTVDGVTYPAPSPFIVLATQNPVEFVGTFPLPEAQLDRFMMRLSIGYPTMREELDILARFSADEPLALLTPVAGAQDLAAIQEQVAGIRCAEEIRAYIVDIVARTRVYSDLQLGASPRAAIHLMRAAQAQALIEGRDYVIPEDVRGMTEPVLAHRLVLKPEARLKELTAARVLSSIQSMLTVPVVLSGDEERLAETKARGRNGEWRTEN